MIDEKKSSDFLWKIVLCGDSFVGKTTIRKRAMGEHFAEEYISTVGADFSSYKLKLGDLTIGFQVWDLAGQDKYKYIRSSFYGGATGCFLVFDVTNPKTMKNLSTWVDEAIRYSNGTIEIFIICANKIDLKNERQITREIGEKYAVALRESSGLFCEYIETSALTGENVNLAFDLMAKCLLEREGISITKTEEMPKVAEKGLNEEQIDMFEKTLTEKPVQQISRPLEVLTKKVITPAPEEVGKIGIKDQADKETDQLIAEVMAVLGETEEIIVGKETTRKGEKTITVPIEDIEKKLPVKDKLPKVSSDLEKVLKQINIKLDSITDRLKDLELEISHVKYNDTKIPEKEQGEIEEFTNELDLLAQLPISSETPSKSKDEEKITERIKSFGLKPVKSEPPTTPKTALVENEDETLDQNQRILESLVDITPAKKPLEEISPEKKEGFGKDSQNNELMEIPGEEPLVSIDEDESNAKLIGTELSSAMISELKELSEETEEVHEDKLSQPLEVTDKEKSLCPICGEEMKYIRQYNKYYCVKCGRYII